MNWYSTVGDEVETGGNVKYEEGQARARMTGCQLGGTGHVKVTGIDWPGNNNHWSDVCTSLKVSK